MEFPAINLSKSGILYIITVLFFTLKIINSLQYYDTNLASGRLWMSGIGSLSSGTSKKLVCDVCKAIKRKIPTNYYKAVRV